MERELSGPRCPTCGGPLVAIGSSEIGIAEADIRRRHAYWCPAGCRGAQPDGTFEFFECPSCGSADTAAVVRSDNIEELECNACGTITSVQVMELPK